MPGSCSVSCPPGRCLRRVREELPTAEESAALSWLTRASRPLTDLADDLVASELLIALGKTSTGRTVTSSTWDKRRAVLHRAVEFARWSGWIEVNPLNGRRRSLALRACWRSIRGWWSTRRRHASCSPQ